MVSKSVVNVKIASLHDPEYEVEIHAFVLGKLTSALPDKRVVVELWSELSGLELADPSFNVPGKIDMLLGADVYGRILLDGIIKAPLGAPIAQRTTLGWILSGPIHFDVLDLHKNICVNHIHVDENELLKKFWELEADNFVTDPKQNYTDEEKKCEETFAATTTSDSTGPFLNSSPSCQHGNFEAIVTRRFNKIERRFAKDTQIKKHYAEVINECIDLGHAEIVPKEEQDKAGVVILPHYPVVQENITATKLRVVFNASYPGTNGVLPQQDLLNKHFEEELANLKEKKKISKKSKLTSLTPWIDVPIPIPLTTDHFVVSEPLVLDLDSNYEALNKQSVM
ncbi:uncharacterized protein [Choristoneura fumiferana]|uniref:uncharacterized protein n=1 Tax=Choristoneura fumiferana TaxID=7141 RepID=UPI003D15AB86